MTATLEDHVRAAERFTEGVWRLFEKKHAPVKTETIVYAIVLQSLAIEHACAVIRLVDCGLAASARALLRPINDAVLRGKWLHYAATPDQLKSVLDRDKFPGVDVMHAALLNSRDDPASAAAFAAVSARRKDVYHSFVHGGSHQIQDRLSSSGIQSVIPESAQIALILVARAYVMIAVADIAIAYGDPSLAEGAVRVNAATSIK